MDLTKLRYQFFFNSYHKKVITYLIEDRVLELEGYLAKIQKLFGPKKTSQLLCYQNDSNLFPLGCAQSTKAIDILRAYGSDFFQYEETVDIYLARPELAVHILRLVFKDKYHPQSSDIMKQYVRDAYFELAPHWFNTPFLEDKKDITLLFFEHAIRSNSPNVFVLALKNFIEYISVLQTEGPQDKKIEKIITQWSNLLLQNLLFYNLEFTQTIIEKINDVYLLARFCKALKENELYVRDIHYHYFTPAHTKLERLQRVDKERLLITDALPFESPTTKKQQFIHKI